MCIKYQLCMMNIHIIIMEHIDKGVRRHEDYMSKYFISQYGAIKDIDFTPIFEEILEREV